MCTFYIYHEVILFFALDTTANSSGKADTLSVSDEIEQQGGRVEFQSSKVSLSNPEGAVPPSTSFLLKPCVDFRDLPPLTSKDEVTLSPAFQLSSSLPQGHPFKKPLQVSVPPDVPLSASDRGNGWQLHMERGESSDGLPVECHTMLEGNTKIAEVICHSSNTGI